MVYDNKNKNNFQSTYTVRCLSRLLYMTPCRSTIVPYYPVRNIIARPFYGIPLAMRNRKLFSYNCRNVII